MNKTPVIILWDLETIPNLPEAMKVWPGLGAYPGLTLKATISTIICFGYKRLGESKSKCINAWDFKNWDKNINDDRELCKTAARILSTADIIVTHNGKSFDYRFLQTRLLFHKLPPLPKMIHIDTKNESKKHLFAYNNRLNTLAQAFTDQLKLDHEGWDLWVGVYNKDPKAMKKMTDYCKQDVITLEALFERLRPLMTSLPNFNTFRLEEECCPNCGSLAIRKRGKRLLKDRFVQRLQCMVCGAWSNLTLKSKVPRSQP